MRSGTVVCPASQVRHACAAGPYGVRGSDPNRFSGMLDSPARVCGRPPQCKQKFEQHLVRRDMRSGTVVCPASQVRHASRRAAHMVFVDRAKSHSAVCLTALRAMLVFRQPSSSGNGSPSSQGRRPTRWVIRASRCSNSGPTRARRSGMPDSFSSANSGSYSTRSGTPCAPVCGRAPQCKQKFEQHVTCGQVLSYVRPLKCGMHAPRAHMVFVDRIQIVSAVCLTALRAMLVFPTPSL